MLEAQDKVIVAFDCCESRAYELADIFAGELVWAKIGMELFYAASSDLIRSFKARGFKLFLDLKLHDIPNTMARAAAVLCELGVDMLTVHAGAGPRAIKAVRASLDEVALRTHKDPPQLIGVTVLTSMDASQMSACGIDRDIDSQALLLARMAIDAGCDGLVCSPHEARNLLEHVPHGTIIITPGIRPQGSSVQDQARPSTPAYAIEQGASRLVVGRPITTADNPLQALRSIYDEVDQALHARDCMR